MDLLNQLFSVFNNTMSIHLREQLPPMAKYGVPGNWELGNINDEISSKELLYEYIDLIYEYMRDEDIFFEDENALYKVIQLKNYRIVITFPPFSDVIEITIVRPTINRVMADYKVDRKLKNRLDERAEGILIAGSPGHGKSTFASALAIYFADKFKIIKTIEKPRDLQLDDRITQFTVLPDDIEKVGDLLLLMRPDYVIFDEIRKNNDFEIYSDMRLSGGGMVGVIHATKPIDASQRFLSRIELGLIPNIIDTVIFINNGEIDTVLSLNMVVKTPRGFNDQSLARPVIEVNDFINHTPLYEMFSFGEQIVVIPLKKNRVTKNSLYKEIAITLKENYYGLSDNAINLLRINNKTIKVSVPENFAKLIKNDFSIFDHIERDYKIKIVLDSYENKYKNIDVFQTKKHLIIKAGREFINRIVDIYIGEKFIMNAKVDYNGEIQLSRKKSTTKRLEKLLDSSDFKINLR